MSVKQKVFAEVEAVAPAHAVLATNTSSLSVSEMASGLRHPERVVGFHFFNPVAVLPLLEIVRGEQTDDASLATAFAVAKKLKKTAVLVKDAPAFVVNRVLTRFMGEIQNIIDEGTPIETAERAIEPLGLPMSPLVLLELVGPAIGLHVSETLNRAFPDRFTVSPNLKAVVEAGKRGFYVYDSGGRSWTRRSSRCWSRATWPSPRSRSATASWTPWRRRSASCWRRASSPRRRTSTCA